jgi:Flp pilus assembly protein TadB
MVYIFVIIFALAAIAAYFFIPRAPKAAAAPLQEKKEQENAVKKAAAAPVVEAPPKTGASFKQLKSQQAKKKGKGASANPEHSSYVSALKGMQSAVNDFDYFKFDDGTTLIVVAEEVSF